MPEPPDPHSISSLVNTLYARSRLVRDLAHDAFVYTHGSQPEKGSENQQRNNPASLEEFLKEMTFTLSDAEQDLIAVTKSINMNAQPDNPGRTNR